MIALESKRLVIVTPPHTASGNLNRALCAPDWRGYRIDGATPTDPDVVSHHYAKIPTGFVSMRYRVALVVRHPLDRLIGLHRHAMYAVRVEGCETFPENVEDFATFVRLVAADDNRLEWLYRWTIDRLVGPLKPDVLIRFETLQQDINMLLGGNVEMDGPHETAHDDWRTLHDPGTLAVATEWARPDLERFGYTA